MLGEWVKEHKHVKFKFPHSISTERKEPTKKLGGENDAICNYPGLARGELEL